MSKTAWINLLAAGLLAGTPARAQDDGVLMLDEMSIKGQVREPAVAIISSRLQPEIEGFKLEKSFFEQVRSPDEELVDLDRGMAGQATIRDREVLLNRARLLQSASWPLTGGAPGEGEKAAGEGQRDK